jgi:uncharacterized metal-binding protein YceD (DUF177 family)
MTGPEKIDLEFSFEIDLDRLGAQGKRYQLAANKTERERIAARLRTPSVEKLEGDLVVSATKTAIRIEGSLTASLTRECVASLEPTSEEVADSFGIDFSRVPPRSEEELLDIEAPDVIEGDTLDLGELLVQQLSLAMEPFPRKPGAPSLAEAYAPAENISPFAILKGALGKSDDNQ